MLNQIFQYLLSHVLGQESDGESEGDRNSGAVIPHDLSNMGSSPSNKANMACREALSAGITASGTTR